MVFLPPGLRSQRRRTAFLLFGKPREPTKAVLVLTIEEMPVGLMHVPKIRSADAHLLWVDRVGGFLILRGGSLSLGSAPESETDDEATLKLMGDLAGTHLQLQRVGEDVRLVPSAAVALSGKSLNGPVCLPTECRIGLGERAEMAISRPFAGSRTVLLDQFRCLRWRSHLRGVVWMDDALLIGPLPSCHIVTDDDELLTEPTVSVLHSTDTGGFAIRPDRLAPSGPLMPGHPMRIGSHELTLDRL